MFFSTAPAPLPKIPAPTAAERPSWLQIAIAGLAVFVLPPVERPETATRRGSARDDRQHHLPLAHSTVTEGQRVTAE